MTILESSPIFEVENVPRRQPRRMFEWSDPIVDSEPIKGLRHVNVKAGTMGQAAREGLALARTYWKWLRVESVAGITETGTGWRVTVRVVDDQNPLRRRLWRLGPTV